MAEKSGLYPDADADDRRLWRCAQYAGVFEEPAGGHDRLCVLHGYQGALCRPCPKAGLQPVSEEAVYWVFRGSAKVDRIFSGFVRGKLLDSLIIGVLCFIGCSLLDMPYTPLVSVFVGVTNVIPFFGPFLGAIPSFFLILLVDPIQSLYFLLFVLALQQLDGNVIGPKILGTSIGINGFWVLFSIVIFGRHFRLFGGMLLGVPAFVIIYTALEMVVNRKLKKHDLPIDAESYMNLDYIDPETLELVPKRRVKPAEKTEAKQENKKVKKNKG